MLKTFPRLAERLEHQGSQLSGGEQQMLSIGRALMINPLLLILDEATEGLAPQIVEEIWRVIALIRADGIATLIVDRDYRRVLAQADSALAGPQQDFRPATPLAAPARDPLPASPVVGRKSRIRKHAHYTPGAARQRNRDPCRTHQPPPGQRRDLRA